MIIKYSFLSEQFKMLCTVKIQHAFKKNKGGVYVIGTVVRKKKWHVMPEGLPTPALRTSEIVTPG